MSRNSFRQGVNDAQRVGEPNRDLYCIDPDYADGFDGYMKEHPIIEELKEEKIRTDTERDILAENQ